MKKVSSIYCLSVNMILLLSLFSCSKNTTQTAAANLKTETFEVWGNCGMCERTIETAARKVVGVSKADWNVETHQFEVLFDTAKTSIEKVHEAIAAVGYDTDKVRGNDKAYQKLHSCCKYDRKKS